jgi:predicted DNA-binding transcriptional regulator YafY
MLRGGQTRTADDLARALGVTVRTIYRDLDELSASGLPVRGCRGPTGGYQLAEHYPIDPFVYVQADPPAGFSGTSVGAGTVGQALDTAVGLLANSLPRQMRDVVERARDRFLFDTSAWLWHDSTRPQFTELRASVLKDESVELAYIDRDHSKIETDIVDPYGLVWKQGNWYLVAYSHSTSRFGRHRIQRVVGVRPSGLTFKRNEDFSIAETWRELLDDFGRGSMLVRIRIDFPATKDFESFGWKPDQHIERHDDHWIVEMNVDRDEWIIPLALTYGDKFQVLEPESLRIKVANALSSALDLYRSRSLSKAKSRD